MVFLGGRRRLSAALLPLALLAGCIPHNAGQTPPTYQPPDYGQTPAYEHQSIGVTALPSAPPAWEARRVTADARSVTGGSYTVASGDTLRAIGIRTGAGSEAIARANNLAAPYVIYPGQRLNVPGGRYHVVREGETGIAIARAYGVPWGEIVTSNGLQPPYILRVDQRVMIPARGTTQPLTQSAAAVASSGGGLQLDIDSIVTGGEPAIGELEAPVRAASTTGRVLPSSAAIATPARFNGKFQWPVRGNIVTRFGAGGSGVFNDGVKIGVPLDTPVQAAADGVVAYVGSSVPGLGGIVILKHDAQWTSIYGHASQLLVQRGQSVKRGQVIALSGDSGTATRPELHFELRQGRTPIDPAKELPPI